jgi:hypothetical protein
MLISTTHGSESPFGDTLVKNFSPNLAKVLLNFSNSKLARSGC